MWGVSGTYDAIVASHGLLSGVFREVRALGGPKNGRAKSVGHGRHDEEGQEIVGVVVKDVGCNEERVSNATDEHGEALTEQKGDRRRNKVRRGKSEV